MGVKFPENSLGHSEISTRKPYKTKPLGGESAQFSRTSVIRSEIKPMLQHFFNALGLRLSRFQSLRNGAGTQMTPDSKSIETAFEVISSYIFLVFPKLFIDLSSISLVKNKNIQALVKFYVFLIKKTYR